MCPICKAFLHDFLESHLPQDLPFSKQIRMKSLKHIQPELSDWMYKFYIRLPKEEFQKAVEIASRIARRGRPLREYECLIHTATFNFLKVSLEWITPELHYIQPILLEGGFIHSRHKQGDMITATSYISYMLPKAILVLNELHEDHIKPKGLLTSMTHLQLQPHFQHIESKDDDLYT